MKALVVTEIEMHNPGMGTWKCMEDYTFINPAHVMTIKSLSRKLLQWDEDLEELVAMVVYTYEVILVGGLRLQCLVEDREDFYNKLTGE